MSKIPTNAFKKLEEEKIKKLIAQNDSLVFQIPPINPGNHDSDSNKLNPGNYSGKDYFDFG